MTRQLILIVRCFKQLKAEQNMDRGAEGDEVKLGSGEKFAWQAVHIKQLILFI